MTSTRRRAARPSTRAQKLLRRVLTSMAAVALLATPIAAPVSATVIERTPPALVTQLTNDAQVYTVCPHLTESINRLYAAYFGRAPDAAGFGFWVDELANGHRDLDDISTFFAQSSEFVSAYGSDSGADDFVELVYQNVLGRSADAAGLDFWSGRLDRNELSRGAVMLNFSESPEFVALTNTAPPLAGHFDWYPEGTQFLCGRGTFELTSIDGAVEIDVLSFIDPQSSTSDPQSLEIVFGRSDSTSISTALVNELVPLDHLVLRNIDVSSVAGADHLEIRADPSAFTYIVVLPETRASFNQRSGWGQGERLSTVRELTSDIDQAVAAVDQFWAANAEQLTGRPYDPPRVLGIYDGTDPATAPSCGPIVLGPNNAFYCGRTHSIAWDLSLMSAGHALGDAFVYFVVAHEWGHAIQSQLNAPLVDVASELQADCFAGAALYGAVAAGPNSLHEPWPGSAIDRFGRLRVDDQNRLIFEPGDVDELAMALTSLSDEEPWTNPRSHGNAEQRIDAFGDGAAGGPAACLTQSRAESE